MRAQWTQFFDNHLGFYVEDSGLLAQVRQAARQTNEPPGGRLRVLFNQAPDVFSPTVGVLISLAGVLA